MEKSRGSLLTLFSLLMMISLLSMQTTFAQEEESEKIEVDIEDVVGTEEKDTGEDSEKEVTLEEQIGLETSEPSEDPTQVETAEPEDDQILAPLKQIQLGISSSDVVCKEGLELIIKASNGSPACVSSSTALALVERGWA